LDGRERERERERERDERTLLMHGSPTSHPCGLIGELISIAGINSNEPEPHTQRERERERERETGMTHSIEGPREASCGIEQADQRHAWSIETQTSRERHDQGRSRQSLGERCLCAARNILAARTLILRQRWRRRRRATASPLGAHTARFASNERPRVRR